MATVLPVSAHCPGIMDGSEAYAAQFGIGTADPMQTSSVSALDSPGAPRAALYSAVGVGLWKSPTPPRRIVGAPPPPPPHPPAHQNPTPGGGPGRPGSQESSSLSSRPTLSTRCGSPALPPNASVATP